MKVKQCEKHQIQLNELITDEHKRDIDASKHYGHQGQKGQLYLLTSVRAGETSQHLSNGSI